MNTLTRVRFETSRKNLRRNLEAAAVVVNFKPVGVLFRITGSINHTARDNDAKAANVEPAHTLTNSFHTAEVEYTLQEAFLHAAFSYGTNNRVEMFFASRLKLFVIAVAIIKTFVESLYNLRSKSHSRPCDVLHPKGKVGSTFVVLA